MAIAIAVAIHGGFRPRPLVQTKHANRRQVDIVWGLNRPHALRRPTATPDYDRPISTRLIALRTGPVTREVIGRT
jgi:hypothetical protein